MKSFRVEDGDFSLNKSRRADMVLGRDKLVQDLSLWLLEPLGIGFTTPSFGALLNYQDVGSRGARTGHFIGRMITEERIAEVGAEVDRILNLYQQNQIQKIRKARLEGTLHLYHRSEILDSVEEVSTAEDADRLIVSVGLTTGANSNLTLSALIDEEETTVAAS